MSRPEGSGQRVIVITGPTATGKSALGVRLAQSINGEIVSADSMQVYTHMDIGTAKPTSDEMGGIPHHLIDCVPPWEEYSVARYVEDASKCVDDIFRRNKQPILVGGTGLYIDSLLAGRFFQTRGADDLRRELEKEYDDIGGEAMLVKLHKVDNEAATKLHANDKKRIVRALEAFHTTGKPISEHNAESKTLPKRYDSVKIALMFSNRETLYSRIDHRVDAMMATGLEQEVNSLLQMNISRNCTSMQAIGYKEISDAIIEGADISTAVEKIKTESRRYGKRQLTWLRRDSEVKWLTWESEPNLESGVKEVTTLMMSGKLFVATI